MLFDMVAAFAYPVLLDYSFLKRYLFQEIAIQSKPDVKKRILRKFLANFKLEVLLENILIARLVWCSGNDLQTNSSCARAPFAHRAHACYRKPPQGTRPDPRQGDCAGDSFGCDHPSSK